MRRRTMFVVDDRKEILETCDTNDKRSSIEERKEFVVSDFARFLQIVVDDIIENPDLIIRT